MQLSSFPAVGLNGVLSSKKPPVWALSILEDTIVMLRESGDSASVARIEKEIFRIEQDLAVRFAR